MTQELWTLMDGDVEVTSAEELTVRYVCRLVLKYINGDVELTSAERANCAVRHISVLLNVGIILKVLYNSN